MSSGSEVALVLAAHQKLSEQGVASRVVSMPCWRLFEAQDQSYRDGVLLPNVKARISVEEGSTFGWERYVGETGESLGVALTHIEIGNIAKRLPILSDAMFDRCPRYPITRPP